MCVLRVYVLLLLAVVCASGLVQGRNITNWVDIGGALPGIEPSGVAVLPKERLVFTVGDEGQVCWLSMDDYSRVVCNKVADAPDLEGITWAPSVGSSIMYLAQESDPPMILEYQWQTNTLLRKFDLTDYVKVSGSHGIEALQFIPYPGEPSGGLFWACSQYNGICYILRLPLLTSGTSVEAVGHFYPPLAGATDTAGITFVNDRVYMTVDKVDTMFAFDTTGSRPVNWALRSGPNQEGVAFYNVTPAGTATMYLADDSGTMWMADIAGLLPPPQGNSTLKFP